MNMEAEAEGLWSWVYGGICVFLVLLGGTMSGLTLGLMSLDLVEMEVLQRSGTPEEKKQAATIFPVVKKQHQLLVTLLLCNALAMEALPIFLDNLVHPVVAVILSVTFVLAFGEIIPQSICSRYGLAVGASLIWLVRFLMVICFPVSYPVAKLLDFLLGHNDAGLFRRAQLKALVSIHGLEAGKGGELSHDETTIISGALDLTEKTAEEAMTPIESTFSLDVNTKLDWEVMGKILATGHSRVPVYSGSPKNIIGLLLVKSLLTVSADADTPLSSVPIRRMPRVPAELPLYDILNEFQKGQSHMAAVVKRKAASKSEQPSSQIPETLVRISRDDQLSITEVSILRDGHTSTSNDIASADIEKGQLENSRDGAQQPFNSQGGDDLEGDVIGIITLEDVIEEILQEEIVDETDEYVDVHRRIRVVTNAISTMKTVGIRRISSQKSARNATSQPERIKSMRDTSASLTQPLLEKR